MKFGVDRELEEQANELIRQSLEGVTSHEAKKDILTPWKQADRYRREVYVVSGTPDPAIRKGFFHRVYNRFAPHLASRDGVAPANHSSKAYYEYHGYEDNPND